MLSEQFQGRIWSFVSDVWGSSHLHQGTCFTEPVFKETNVQVQRASRTYLMNVLAFHKNHPESVLYPTSKIMLYHFVKALRFDIKKLHYRFPVYTHDLSFQCTRKPSKGTLTGVLPCLHCMKRSCITDTKWVKEKSCAPWSYKDFCLPISGSCCYPPEN